MLSLPGALKIYIASKPVDHNPPPNILSMTNPPKIGLFLNISPAQLRFSS